MTNRRAFSLVEAVISMLVVSVLLVSAMRAVAASKTGQLIVADRTAATLLAQDLLAEIVMFPFEDPDGGATMGPDTGESDGGTRAAFDDVDDYHGWKGSPVTDHDGTAIDSASGLQRSVTVTWARASDLGDTAFSNTGVKRIDVVVMSGTRELARLFTFKCSANKFDLETRSGSSLERIR